MNFPLAISQHGWVSLPIIALLLAVSALSVRYQNDLLAAYQWRGQLNDVEEGQQVWIEFKSEFVASPDFSSALDSECVGFCDLLTNRNNDNENEWQSAISSTSNQSLHYQWARYESVGEESAEDEGVDLSVSYRLCATQNQQNYLCWWWREGKLISNGWVSITDS